MAFKSSKKPLVVYYGHGRLQALAGFRCAVLQVGHYSAADLAWLKRRGVTPLAYLSIGEDAGPSAPWQRPQSNAAWHTAYVQVGDPRWQQHLRKQADAALAKGFEGLFLDTLDTVDLFLSDRAAFLELVGALQAQLETRPLLVNRGFGLLPELASFVDGVVLEAFSTRWLPEGGCAVLTPEELEWTSAQAAALHTLHIPAYALDYCHTRALAAFARRRARRHGLASLISNRDLTCIYEGKT